MDTSAVPVILYIAVIIFALVLIVCWIVLPFAVIGTKSLLRDLLWEQRRTNELLAKLTVPAALPPAPSRTQADTVLK